jgi:hypothetical protein
MYLINLEEYIRVLRAVNINFILPLHCNTTYTGSPKRQESMARYNYLFGILSMKIEARKLFMFL